MIVYVESTTHGRDPGKTCRVGKKATLSCFRGWEYLCNLWCCRVEHYMYSNSDSNVCYVHCKDICSDAMPLDTQPPSVHDEHIAEQQIPSSSIAGDTKVVVGQEMQPSGSNEQQEILIQDAAYALHCIQTKDTELLLAHAPDAHPIMWLDQVGSSLSSVKTTCTCHVCHQHSPPHSLCSTSSSH